jgi:penicillin-binding protein 2
MQDVVERGTATTARIPGIDMCAKTGTAQNFRFIRGKKIELNENSMFVAFAPRENPKIAICVVIENAGFGSTSAAPIASLLIEKFLNDTLSAASVIKAEELAKKDLMPAILAVEQYIADSVRAQEWLKITKDSTLLKRFLKTPRQSTPQKDPDPKPRHTFLRVDDMILPGTENVYKQKRSKV